VAIVARGLGQPEDGALVAAGLGTAEPAAPGAMAALIVGVGTVTATLVGDTGTPPEQPDRVGVFHARPQMPPLRPAPLHYITDTAAHLTGGASVTATLTATTRTLPTVEEQLLQLLALELV
jgi:hypothetical protein